MFRQFIRLALQIYIQCGITLKILKYHRWRNQKMLKVDVVRKLSYMSKKVIGIEVTQI